MSEKRNNYFEGLHTFFILWITQTFSELGSSMTSFALVIWAYGQSGSALTTALLSICSYGPYVIFSIFAGALSDKWNKKYTMLACDAVAAVTTVLVLYLLKTGNLEVWQLYVINAINGMMNTIQQPASDVAVTLVTPEKQYQRISGLKAFSNSLVTILTPAIATAVLAFFGMEGVILFDLATFSVAFVVLVFWISIPKGGKKDGQQKETVFQAAGEGIKYLCENRGILDLILFLAAINLTASMYNAALPAMILSMPQGGEYGLGMVNTFTGLSSLLGSILVSLCPAPESRIRVICNSLLFSMATENLILALGKSVPVWCVGAVLGWIFIPVMGANMDALLRHHIPVEMQGRVYSARNTLQFFTIPLGYLLGGFLVDRVCEPFMAAQQAGSILTVLLGSHKGSGAALLFLVIALSGTATCLVFRKDRYLWALEDTPW